MAKIISVSGSNGSSTCAVAFKDRIVDGFLNFFANVFAEAIDDRDKSISDSAPNLCATNCTQQCYTTFESSSNHGFKTMESMRNTAEVMTMFIQHPSTGLRSRISSRFGAINRGQWKT